MPPTQTAHSYAGISNYMLASSWMDALNLKQVVSVISLDVSHAFKLPVALKHNLLSQVLANGIQTGQYIYSVPANCGDGIVTYLAAICTQTAVPKLSYFGMCL